jgi:hypothetical protein
VTGPLKALPCSFKADTHIKVKTDDEPDDMVVQSTMMLETRTQDTPEGKSY